MKLNANIIAGNYLYLKLIILITPYSEEWFDRDIKNRIDFRYTNIPQNIKNEYLKIINTFNIKNEIVENIKKL